MPSSLGPGTYVLVLRIPAATDIVVGRLGRLHFPGGYYLYVGSALGGLEGRLSRHLRARKRLHWHIDYLLTVATLCQVWYRTSNEREECVWARSLAAASEVSAPYAGFGASDCRSRPHPCHAHLFAVAASVDPAKLRLRLPGHPPDIVEADELAQALRVDRSNE